MSVNTGLFLKYTTNSGVDAQFRISDYCFDSRDWNKAHDKEARKGRIFYLYCPCGANDWSENGRFIGEFECECCAQYVQVTDYSGRQVEISRAKDATLKRNIDEN